MTRRDDRYYAMKHRGKQQEKAPKTEKRIIVGRCSVCDKNKPIWSSRNGIRCKECHEKSEEE